MADLKKMEGWLVSSSEKEAHGKGGCWRRDAAVAGGERRDIGVCVEVQGGLLGANDREEGKGCRRVRGGSLERE